MDDIYRNYFHNIINYTSQEVSFNNVSKYGRLYFQDEQSSEDIDHEKSVELYLQDRSPQKNNNYEFLQSYHDKFLFEELSYVKSRNDKFLELITACGYGFYDVVKNLIQESVDINRKDVNGNSPLMIACDKNKFEIVKLLIESGADMHTTNKQGHTVIKESVYTGNLDLVRYLLSCGTDVDSRCKYGTTSLMTACDRGYVDMVKLLLEYNADVNIIDCKGKTCLFYACRFSHYDVIEILLKAGIHVNHKDKKGKTVLEFACKYGILELIKLLINHGGNINIVNERGENCFIVACSSRHAYSERPKIIKFLIDNYANMYQKNKDKYTGFDLLVIRSSVIIKYIIDKGYDHRKFIGDNSNKDMDTYYQEIRNKTSAQLFYSIVMMSDGYLRTKRYAVRES